MYKNYLKRIFDLFSSIIGIILLIPIIVPIIILIKFSSKGPLFFVQKRVGKNFKEFNLYKFRSMVVDAPNLGPSVTAGDDPRITRVGKIIRRTKIDELPQLFNVIKGDMSLVGPRPEVIKFVNKKKEDYTIVLSVLPGITDNAAIEYVNEEKIMEQYEDKEEAYVNLVLPEKIILYKYYVNNISFINDIKLILKTLKVI